MKNQTNMMMADHRTNNIKLPSSVVCCVDEKKHIRGHILITSLQKHVQHIIMWPPEYWLQTSGRGEHGYSKV